MTRQYEYDVIVVGHGISGLSTGLGAYEQGADVIILEKSPEEKRGGHSRFAGGLFRFPVEDPEQAKDDLGLEQTPELYTRDDFYADLMGVSDGRADPELCQVFVDEAYAAMRWITEHGVTWRHFDTSDEVGYGQTVGAVQSVGEGDGAVSALTDRVAELGIDRHYETEMREILVDEGNRVTGVQAITEDGWVTYSAPAVVLCAGSYVSNPEKRTRYFGRDGDSYVVRGSRYNTGEALDAAMNVGAMPGGQWGGAHQVMLDANAPQVEGGRTRINGYQYGIILNENGTRFVDEGEDFLLKTYAKMGQALYDQPGHEAYVIYDNDVADVVMSQLGSDPIITESMDELIEMVGVNAPAAAKQTIEAYNAACDPGEFDPDELDGNRTTGITPRKSNWALPIDSPPFYCYPVRSGITFAFGGLDVTTESEVLSTRNTVIPGLWAVGNSTSNFFYGNYPGGSALSRGATFGRKAGKNAAEYALNSPMQSSTETPLD